jgi:hypothetical protein
MWLRSEMGGCGREAETGLQRWRPTKWTSLNDLVVFVGVTFATEAPMGLLWVTGIRSSWFPLEPTSVLHASCPSVLV